MNFYDKEIFIKHIQTAFIIITSILTISFYSSGCISKNDPFETTLSKSVIAVEDNSGIATVIRDHFKTSLGQIIAIENYSQASAQALVTVTTPAPDKVKVYLLRRDEKWIIERIQNSIDETDMEN